MAKNNSIPENPNLLGFGHFCNVNMSDVPGANFDGLYVIDLPPADLYFESIDETVLANNI
jgi:hypothetical protein